MLLPTFGILIQDNTELNLEAIGVTVNNSYNVSTA
jgi:hypothetical protein